MNLLPKNRQDFAHKDYWDSFFQKRGNKAFEWYGEYPELCVNLHKYIKTKDEVLIVGCGNSILGNDLYDAGFRKITSIDISKVAIRQMKNMNEKRRPELKFLHMDALQTAFEDGQFAVIIDKGTLDALMPDNEKSTVLRVRNYFTEMLRILAINGRYVCITLLQEHILATMLDYFPKNGCMFRAVRCHDVEKIAEQAGESPMPVFMVICTKFNSLSVKVLELSLGEKMIRFDAEEELVGRVREAQQAAMICTGLKRSGTVNDGDISFDVFKDGNDSPRYAIHVVDVPPDRKFSRYAAFIVPQGRESEWLFSTTDGRKQLSKMSKCNRLAVVTLHRGQVYKDLDAIKQELGDSIRNFAPSSIGEERIQFLSLGSDVGERTVRYEGNSNFSGDYVIEDVLSSNSKFRRLFYLSSQLVVQSEAKLITGKSRNITAKEKVDLTYLTCGHHFHMSRGVHMATSKKENASVAIVGLGGGGLCSFLRKFLPKVCVTSIDIDEAMLVVATDWFGLCLDDHMKVELIDGIAFLKNALRNHTKYEAILFDVDNKDTTIGMSCPPKEFLDPDSLDLVSNCLTEEGLFIVNVVLRNGSLRPDIVKLLNSKFPICVSCKLEEDLNEVFICCVRKRTVKMLRNLYIEATRQMNTFFSKNNNKELTSDEDGKCLRFCDATI